jgi:hypothetical protein
MLRSGKQFVRLISRKLPVFTAFPTNLPIGAAAVALAILGYRSLGGQETIEAYQLSRGAQQGQAVSPVPLALRGKGPTLILQGSYLVNAQGGCNSCHTCPSYRGTDPYKVGGHGLGNDPTPVNSVNFLSGGTPFVNGTILSPNLTPDSSGRPGGLTYKQFKSAMHDGEDSHNITRVLQVMPWHIYRNLDEHDFRAIYAYLSAIPTAPSGAGQCTAPDQTR